MKINLIRKEEQEQLERLREINYSPLAIKIHKQLGFLSIEECEAVIAAVSTPIKQIYGNHSGQTIRAILNKLN